MGLAASQARLLNLTARMHDIEYKAQNLEAQKLQMANESTQVYKEYEAALNEQKVQIKSIGADGSATYVDVTGQALQNAGYVFQVAYGANSGQVYNSIEDAAQAASGQALDTDAIGGVDGTTQTVTNLLQAGFIVLVKCPVDDTGAFVKPTDGDTIEEYKEACRNMAGIDEPYETNIATDTSLQEVQDETRLKKAEAKYEADMRKIDAKDKKFDTDLAAMEAEMEAERNAIKTEIDTLKTVAKDNVDRTFKLFS